MKPNNKKPQIFCPSSTKPGGLLRYIPILANSYSDIDSRLMIFVNKPDHLYPCYLKCGLLISWDSITRELFRNASSWVLS